mgnify:CR=1 FL=1
MENKKKEDKPEIKSSSFKDTEKSEPKEEWPPQVGIWAGASRVRALRFLPLDPEKDVLIEGVVPRPGFIINGVGIIGRQYLVQNMWDMINAGLSGQAANEETFIRGGREKTKNLGTFKG